MKNGDIISDKYIIIRKINEGLSSKIYLVKDKETQKEYVAKIFKNNINNDKEIEIYNRIKELNNIGILKLYSSGEIKILNKEKEYEFRKYYILEYATKGDLFKYIFFSRGLGEKLSPIIFKKILLIIDEIHKKGIYHLDLKLENILLDDNYNPKIYNFSSSKTIEESNNGKFSAPVGTPGYMPPQMILGEEYNGEKADIFNLGIILFNLVIGNNRCFIDCSNNDKYYNYIKCNTNKDSKEYWKLLKSNEIFEYKKYPSENFKKLFIKMVAFKEDDRPTIQQILQDDWFNEISSKNINNDNIIFSENDLYIKFLHLEQIYKATLIRSEILANNNNMEIENNQETYTKDEFFENFGEIKFIKENEIMDNCIRIKCDLNKFLDYINNIIKKIKQFGKIDFFKNKCKFNLIIEKSENKNINFDDINNIKKELIIQIKLFKDKNGDFLVRFTKRNGELYDYYRYLIFLMNTINNYNDKGKNKKNKK